MHDFPCSSSFASRRERQLRLRSPSRLRWHGLCAGLGSGCSRPRQLPPSERAQHHKSPFFGFLPFRDICTGLLSPAKGIFFPTFWPFGWLAGWSGVCWFGLFVCLSVCLFYNLSRIFFSSLFF